MVHVDAPSCLPWRLARSTQRVLARRQAGWVHARRPRHEEAPGPAGAGHAGVGTDIDHPTGRLVRQRLGLEAAGRAVRQRGDAGSPSSCRWPLQPRSWLASPTASPRRWRPMTSLRRIITQELSRMQEVRLGKTASRSVLGIMNEFTFLAQTMRGDTTTDLTDLASWLARTPCSPLFKRHGSPDRELRAPVEAADQETPTR